MQFGEFEVDLRARELRRNGDRIRLQDQPFGVLEVLLERAGEVVTREQLRQRLWASDTFVDFDNNLNTAINKIRDAIGDSAEDPRFVETLPRRGYRFIAAVNDADVRAGHNRKQSMSLARPVLVAGLVLAVGIAAMGVWRRSYASLPRIAGSRQLTNDGIPKIFFLVTDGSRVYFNEVLSGRITLNQVSTAGGETAVINTSVPDPVVEAISPEHSHLLVQTGKDQWDPEGSDFWLVPLPAGSPRRMEGIIGRYGGWTPNGKFYFLRANDIYVADHDGGNPHKIATAPGAVDYIQCSPDGSRLRFMIFDLGNSAYSTWEIRADGSGLHRLLPEWKELPGECCGTWSPDGRYYFFQDKQQVVNLWVMSDRSALVQKSAKLAQLTAGPLSYYFPVSSNDGKQIYAMGFHGRGELVRYEKKSENFVAFLGGISVREANFSHDGKWVAYVRYSEGDLWSRRGESEEPIQLTFSPMQVASARWSPDGQQIAFSALMPGGTWKVRRMSRHGGAPEELTKSTDLVEVAPDWSPDGGTPHLGPTFQADRIRAPSNCSISRHMKLPRCLAPRACAPQDGRLAGVTWLQRP